MNKKKLYMIVGIILLIISIAGSAYSYYSLVWVNENSVYGTASGSASMNLKVEKISIGAIGSLIPVDNDTTTLTKAVVGEANTNFDDNKRCIDKNGYAACQIYKVTLTNKSSIALVVSGGVSLKGDNTPNIECAIMTDINTVADNTSCRGTKTLANNYTIKANESKVYYIMVYVKNLNKVQTDTGEFTGTIFFSADNGDKLKANFEPNKETIADYITNLYTNASKTPVENNGITYNYASSESLMNDRLGGTTTSLDGGNIRYYGANPNNYIYFNCETYPDTNCELWRIIGVFDGKVKIMRNESIGQYSWDRKKYSMKLGTEFWELHGKNEWNDADLMKLLNSGYESESVGGSLYYNSRSGTCYNSNSGATSCDFTSTGIKNDITRNKIAEVTWNLGGWYWNKKSTYSNQVYEYERGTTVYSGRSTTWTGKVALAYPSDYGYAVDFNKCSENLGKYYINCYNENWVYSIFTDSGTSNGWFLSPESTRSDYVWPLSSSGYVGADSNFSSYYTASYLYNVTPTLFLNSTETIVEGTTGTEDNPYKLNP